jgi:predicted GIY-YIG superfamily endonuclease
VSADQVPTALYRLFGDGDSRVYIGIAKNFGKRWQEHARSQPWWPEVRRQTIDWYPDRDTAEAAEEAAIKAEHPKYNLMHNRGVAAKSPRAREDDRLLGAAIRRLRTGRRMSQAVLAEYMRAGGHQWYQNTVVRVERGQRTLGFREAIDVAEIFGTSHGELAAMTWGAGSPLAVAA